jgi:hypothetical protein
VATKHISWGTKSYDVQGVEMLRGASGVVLAAASCASLFGLAHASTKRISRGSYEFKQGSRWVRRGWVGLGDFACCVL